MIDARLWYTYRLIVVVGDLNCCYGRIDSAYEEEEEIESVSEHC